MPATCRNSTRFSFNTTLSMSQFPLLKSDLLKLIWDFNLLPHLLSTYCVLGVMIGTQKILKSESAHSLLEHMHGDSWEWWVLKGVAILFMLIPPMHPLSGTLLGYPNIPYSVFYMFTFTWPSSSLRRNKHSLPWYVLRNAFLKWIFPESIFLSSVVDIASDGIRMQLQLFTFLASHCKRRESTRSLPDQFHLTFGIHMNPFIIQDYGPYPCNWDSSWNHYNGSKAWIILLIHDGTLANHSHSYLCLHKCH